MLSRRIQHLQWFGALFAAAACLLLGGGSLLVNYQDYIRYDSGARQLENFHSALIAANAVSAERAPANNVMTAPSDRQEAPLAALAVRRAETDLRIDQMQARLAGELANSSELRGVLQSLRQTLVAARGEVDRVGRITDAMQRSTATAPAIEAMFSAADLAGFLRDRIGNAVVRVAPQVGTEVILGTASSALREQTGRLGSYVVMQLILRDRNDPAVTSKLAATHARISQIGILLANYAGGYFSDPVIENAVLDVRNGYFGKALPYALRVAQQADNAQRIEIAEFAANYVPGMMAADKLRELIIATSQAKIAGLRSAALRNVVVSTCLTVLVVLILLMLAVLFGRALFTPLIKARDQIVAIARNDLSDPAPMPQASREMRDIFEGLDTLRQHQRHKVQLEDDQRSLTDQLKKLSETDVLTGLLNRRAIEALAPQILDESDARLQSLCIVMLDIDHFKTINDTYGHAIGDNVLQKVANHLQPLLRPGDTFARYGGEEFVMLLRNVRLREAAVVAERLRVGLSQVIMSEEHKLFVTGSFGVAMRELGSRLDWEQLIVVADRRLYAAKRAGRNQVCLADADRPIESRTAAA